MDSRFNAWITLCVVHEDILVGLDVAHAHLHLAALGFGLLLGLHRAQFVVGGYFVGGAVVVEDADEEGGEGGETGADYADGDFGVSVKI